jgi:hypothetical protein
MTADEWRAFVGWIASAPGEDEDAVFEEGIERLGASRHETDRLEALFNLGAFAEVAMAIWRYAFPDRGFVFGTTIGAAPKGVAWTWEQGASHGETCEAATPALALLKSWATESAKRADAREAAECTRCRGLGWYVTRANTKVICRHDVRDAAA